MNNPFISIITCTYNSEKFIKKNLNSVKSQTYHDYEQIIIDANSTDRTNQIIKSFQKDNSKIKIFSFPPKGISDAFNKGIEKSSGKYLFFLNSDDLLYDKNVLQDVVIYLKSNPDLDWLYGKINVIEENGESAGVFPNRKIFQIADKNLLKFFNFIPHQAVFMKNTVFHKFGKFDIRLMSNMDYDFWLKVSNKTKWKFYNRIISKYMIRKGSTSSSVKNKNNNIRMLEIVQNRHLIFFERCIVKIFNLIVFNINKTYR